MAQQVQGIVGRLGDAMRSNDASLQGLWNTLFWIAIALAACLVLHAAAR